MKKGQHIGITQTKAGQSGEKYVNYDKSINKYVVMIPTHGKDKRKQITVGKFLTVAEAVLCRDKYLSAQE